MWVVQTKCWKKDVFLPPFPTSCTHPVPPSCWSPYFIIPTLAHTHWEYPVVRCELVGNNKQWRGGRILAGRAQVGPYWYLTPFFHYFYYFYFSYKYLQVQCLYRWAHTDTWHPSSTTYTTSTFLTSTYRYNVSTGGPTLIPDTLLLLLAQTTSTFASTISLEVGPYRYLTPSNT